MMAFVQLHSRSKTSAWRRVTRDASNAARTSATSDSEATILIGRLLFCVKNTAGLLISSVRCQITVGRGLIQNPNLPHPIVCSNAKRQRRMLSVLSTLGPKGVSQLGWRELESASQAAAGLKQAGYSDHDVALWLRAFYTAGTSHEMLSVWRLFDEQGRGAVSAGHLENRLVEVYGEEARETICTLLHRSGGGRSVAAVASASATESGESAGDRAMRRRNEATGASRA